MSTHKSIDRICCVAIVLGLLLSVFMAFGTNLGLASAPQSLGYETRLFDTGRVHTIDIEMDDWDSFLASCENEEYAACTVVIDNESKKNVAIRAKGNTSLRNVRQLGSQRYSFKLEFDHYEEGKTYYGLDKLSLNNLIQDNTMMKDYLTYQLMGQFGVDAPLCSYTYLTVNGEDWGLYLAVEGVEDAFLTRNYGGEGTLYKPDSMDMGGGRGNGREFEMEEGSDIGSGMGGQRPEMPQGEMPQMPDGQMPQMPDGQMPQMPDGQMPQMPDGQMPRMPDGQMPQMPGGQAPQGGGSGMGGSADVKLQYIDDDPDSYANIFENTKTDITAADKKRLIASLKALGEGENLSEVLDMEEVLRYFVVHDFVCNGDSYTGGMIHNYYLHEYDGKLSMIPWDYNLAFGGFQSSGADATVNEPIDSPVTGGSVEDRPMIAWIFDGGEYQQQYHSLYADFLATFDFAAIVGQTMDLIDPYVQKDPTKFCTYDAFTLGAQTLAEFCTLRAESVRGQLDGTIPATEDGQKADASALVDASCITISDMGTMQNGMGERNNMRSENGSSAAGEGTENGGFSGDGGTPGDFAPGQGGQMPGGFAPEKGSQMPGGFAPGQGGQRPGSPEQGRMDLRSLLMLGACVLILIGGLLCTKLFRRK